MDSLPSFTLTSASLIVRVQQHDAAAWERLSKLYGPLVYQWSRRSGLSPEDSADVVQEVFKTLATRIDDFHRNRAGDTFRGWLWTIARHKALDHLRQASRRAAASGGTAALERLHQLTADSPEPWSSDEERSAADHGVVTRAVELLRQEFEPNTWQAFWAATVEGRSAAEIAAALGMTKHAVHQAKYRVLRRLRDELQDLA